MSNSDISTRQQWITDHIARSAMAGWFNLTVSVDGERLLYRLGFQEAHIGNPVIRALHGGVIAGVLESAARFEVLSTLQAGATAQITSVHTSYLSSSRPVDLLCDVQIKRVGRRFAFAEATGWQAGPERVVARAAIGLRINRPAA